MTRNWDLYDTRHVVYRPIGLSPEDLKRGYDWAYRGVLPLGLDLPRPRRPTRRAKHALKHVAYSAGWKKFERGMERRHPDQAAVADAADAGSRSLVRGRGSRSPARSPTLPPGSARGPLGQPSGSGVVVTESRAAAAPLLSDAERREQARRARRRTSSRRRDPRARRARRGSASRRTPGESPSRRAPRASAPRRRRARSTRSRWRSEPSTSEVSSGRTPAAIASASSARSRLPRRAARPQSGLASAGIGAARRPARDRTCWRRGSAASSRDAARAPARPRRRGPRRRRTRRRWRRRAPPPHARARRRSLSTGSSVSRRPAVSTSVTGTPSHVDRRLERVARRARDLRHDRALGADERVEERRLAGVGPAQDRDAAARREQPARLVASRREPRERGARPARGASRRAGGIGLAHVLGEVDRAPPAPRTRRADPPARASSRCESPPAEPPRARPAPRRPSAPRSGRGRPRPARRSILPARNARSVNSPGRAGRAPAATAAREQPLHDDGASVDRDLRDVLAGHGGRARRRT